MLCTNVLNHLRHSQARYQFVTVDCLHLVKFIEGLDTTHQFRVSGIYLGLGRKLKFYGIKTKPHAQK